LGKSILEVVKETFRQYGQDRVPLLAAALSFYTLFSLAPLVLISLRVAGLIFGEQAARGQVYGEIERTVGPDAAKAVQSLVQAAAVANDGPLSVAIGVGLLLLAASVVFAQLKTALNAIWNVAPPPEESKEKRTFLHAVIEFVKKKLFSFLLVLISGLLLIAMLVAGSVIGIAMDVFDEITPFQIAAVQVGDFLVSLLVGTAVFALLFKFVPDTKVRLKDVWLGAAVTALLFTLGKIGISYYLSQKAVGSAYGAAGSLVVIMLWVYYACQIVFLGAELTQVLADRSGARAEKKERKAEAHEAAEASATS
jgi:membrane protein